MTVIVTVMMLSTILFLFSSFSFIKFIMFPSALF